MRRRVSSRSATSACARASSSAPASSRRCDLRGERDGALDERRVVGAGFGRPVAELLGGLARLEQAALGGGQPIVGRPLIVFEPRDRFARFILAAVDAPRAPPRTAAVRGRAVRSSGRGAPLRPRRAAAAPPGPRPPFPALWCSAASAAIAFEAWTIAASSAAVSAARRDERVALRLDAAAQFLDLALRLENAPGRFVQAARHQVRSAEHVAFARRRSAAA